MKALDAATFDRAVEVAREAMAKGECAFWAIRTGIQTAWGDEAAALIAPSNAESSGTKEFIAPPTYIAIRQALGIPWPKEVEYNSPQAEAL